MVRPGSQCQEIAEPGFGAWPHILTSCLLSSLPGPVTPLAWNVGFSGDGGGGRVSTVKWPGFAARLLVQPVILLFLFVAPVPWSVHWGRDNPVVTDVRWGRSCRKHTSEITAYVKCRREGSYEEFSSSLQFLTQPVRESQDSSWVWWKLWLPSVFSAKVGNCLIRLLD